MVTFSKNACFVNGLGLRAEKLDLGLYISWVWAMFFVHWLGLGLFSSSDWLEGLAWHCTFSKNGLCFVNGLGLRALRLDLGLYIRWALTGSM